MKIFFKNISELEKFLIYHFFQQLTENIRQKYLKHFQIISYIKKFHKVSKMEMSER